MFGEKKGFMFPAVVHWCRYTSVTMYVMAKVQTSAGMTKERKKNSD